MLKFDDTVISKIIESLLIHNGDFKEPGTRIRMGPTGFDAKTTRDRYVERAIARQVTPKDKPIAESGNTKYYSKCQPKEDFLMFISVFLKYGNNLNKALRELKFSQILRSKCMLYGIETYQTKHRKLQPNQLSLSRIAMAFPIHTAVMILKKQHNGILQHSSFFQQELPLIMQHTVFPGLVPAEKFTEELKGITSILNMEISVIFHFKKRPLTISNIYWMEMEMEHKIHETVEKLVESSAKYVDSAIKNGIEDGMKLKILTKAGILEVNTDGELELSTGTVALVKKLADIKALYSLKYCDAIDKLNSGE